jgi:hypothetical protein
MALTADCSLYLDTDLLVRRPLLPGVVDYLQRPSALVFAVREESDFADDKEA